MKEKNHLNNIDANVIDNVGWIQNIPEKANVRGCEPRAQAGWTRPLFATVHSQLSDYSIYGLGNATEEY